MDIGQNVSFTDDNDMFLNVLPFDKFKISKIPKILDYYYNNGNIKNHMMHYLYTYLYLNHTDDIKIMCDFFFYSCDSYIKQILTNVYSKCKIVSPEELHLLKLLIFVTKNENRKYILKELRIAEKIDSNIRKNVSFARISFVR